MTLVSDLITRVERRLSQLAGPGTQVYTQDVLLEHLTSAFNTTFDDHVWPGYQVWVTSALDGTVGVCTADLSAIKDSNDRPLPLTDYLDIIGVYPDASSAPLPAAPIDVIPDLVTGTAGRYIIPYPQRPDKVFRVLPFTATGTLYIQYSSRPVNIDMDTDLKVDEELLIAAATFLYLADDATNPTATNIAMGRLQARERKVAQLMAQRIPIGARNAQPVDYYWSS
jgi:hypothetical protein